MSRLPISYKEEHPSSVKIEVCGLANELLIWRQLLKGRQTDCGRNPRLTQELIVFGQCCDATLNAISGIVVIQKSHVITTDSDDQYVSAFMGYHSFWNAQFHSKKCKIGFPTHVATDVVNLTALQNAVLAQLKAVVIKWK